MKTFVLKVTLNGEDGRWSATIPALPGCSSWGYSSQEALEDIIEAGESLPAPSDEVELIDASYSSLIMIHRLRNTPVRELIRAIEQDGFTI